MNINYLETFVYVVQLKSIHKAADALFLSQPTVSARIKTLERELNTELFVRQGRGLLLTEHGKEFMPYAKQIIQKLEEGKSSMKKRDEQEEIVIGANAVTSQYFIPYAMPLWKQLNPLLRFKFIVAPSDVLFEKLLQKKVDLAFTKDLENDGSQQQQLLDNFVKLVVHPNHPLQNEKNVTVDRLAEEFLVLYECEDCDWNRIYKLFEAAEVEPQIEFHVNHFEVAKSIIKNGHAIGFMPFLCVKNELEKGELVEIDIDHLTRMEQHIFLTYVNREAAKWRIVESIVESTKSFTKY